MNRKLKKSLVLAVILTVFLSYFQLFQANQISTVFAEETQETNSKESLSSEDARTEISSTIENSSKASSESVESTAASQTSGSEVASTTTSSFSTDTQPSSESIPTSTNKVEGTTASSEVGPLQSPPTKSLKENQYVQDADWILSQCSTSELFYYNVFLTGNHSQSGADVEGAFAIGGDSEIYQGLDYGVIFADPNLAIGEQTLPDQYVNLLLQGTMYGPGGKTVKIKNNIKNGIFKGYFLYNADKNPNIGNIAEDEVALTNPQEHGGVPLTKAQLTNLFVKLASQRDQLTTALDQLIAHTTSEEIPANVQAVFPGQKLLKTQEEGVYVLELGNRTDVSVSNFLHLIEDERGIKQIIVHSNSEKGYLKLNNNGGALDYGPEFTKVSQKLLYYFPNATQVTNFYNKDGSDSRVYASSRDAAGNDVYNEAYFADKIDNSGNKPNAGQVLGSIIAPQATIVFNGANINGYIYGKDFHGRGGGFEVHNFYNPFIYQITHNFNLHKTGSSNPEGIAGVDFIFLRKNKETYEYLTTEDTFQAFTADVNTITPEDIPNDAKIFTTDENGNVSYTNTESTTIGNCGGSNTPETDYTYFFKETKAQTGYEINGTPQEVSPGETTEFVNQQALQPLPSTGGNGQGILLLFGSLLILAGGFYYRYQEL